MLQQHVSQNLSAYCHGELTPEQARRVAEHVLGCQRCRKELDEIKLGIHLAAQLPRLAAPASLWAELEAKLDQSAKATIPIAERTDKSTWFSSLLAFGWYRLTAVSAALLILSFLGLWYFRQASPLAPSVNKPSWEVVQLDGRPLIEAGRIRQTGRLGVGEWLETGSASRVKINVATIGYVEVEPNTRLRLLETKPTEHRLELARGTMHAMILAPPRLFFVNTPSATAIDLGCAYTLEVDETGASRLHVTSGYVALELNGRESMVPEGAMCSTRPGVGPGTPYFASASLPFRTALTSFDFEAGGSAALTIILAEARPRDSLTLYHLLSRATGRDRERVFARLVKLVPLPDGVTRQGVLELDAEMLDIWSAEMELTWYED